VLIISSMSLNLSKMRFLVTNFAFSYDSFRTRRFLANFLTPKNLGGNCSLLYNPSSGHDDTEHNEIIDR